MRTSRSFIFSPTGMLLILASLLTGCAQPKPTVVITVGGMGFSQMHDLRMAVERQCPNVDVVSAGAWDAYKTDILKIANEKPRQHIILIGHSFGCGAIDDAANQLPKVDLAVFIDPAWSDFPLASPIQKYLWYQRSGFDVEREAQIKGASGARIIKGGHNEIPHSPELVAEVVSAINAIGRGK